MRCHLTDSDEPLHEGGDQVALCGTPINKARFVFMFDRDFDDFLESANTLLFCRICSELEIEKRYVYGILSGQEALDWEARHGREMVEAA